MPENAHRIEELLAAARAADAEVAERAAGASYAGEPDPYRRPDEVEEEADVPEGVGPQGIGTGAGSLPAAAASTPSVSTLSGATPEASGIPHNHDADIGGEDPVDRFGEPIEAQAGAGDRG